MTICCLDLPSVAISAINFLAILQGDYTPLNLGWEALGVFHYFLFSGGGGCFLDMFLRTPILLRIKIIALSKAPTISKITMIVLIPLNNRPIPHILPHKVIYYL